MLPLLINTMPQPLEVPPRIVHEIATTGLAVPMVSNAAIAPGSLAPPTIGVVTEPLLCYTTGDQSGDTAKLDDAIGDHSSAGTRLGETTGDQHGELQTARWNHCFYNTETIPGSAILPVIKPARATLLGDTTGDQHSDNNRFARAAGVVIPPTINIVTTAWLSDASTVNVEKTNSNQPFCANQVGEAGDTTPAW